ncbi:MAG: T9SS type A sorting domain-containing protein [Flavobacteriales bacterium]|nr:T9SS type A sorting domain-containing protein [Flavobacteriales bacterium]
MNLRSALTAMIAAAAMAPLTAQSTVDIGLFRNGEKLEVRLRPTENFNGIVSSLVFTVRWDRNSGAGLGTLVQEGAPAQFIPLAKSGAIRENGTFNYQVYAGFGMLPLTELETSLAAGAEVVIATIPVTGKGEFEIVNDSFTGEAANNANYYISLGGRDLTGSIYKGLATAEEDGSVSILPNPNNGQFTFSFSVGTATDVTIEVVNALGQVVFNDMLRNFEGTYRKEMDLTSASNGVYYLEDQAQRRDFDA